jgi:hypothetical protein
MTRRDLVCVPIAGLSEWLNMAEFCEESAAAAIVAGARAGLSCQNIN